MNGCFNAGHVVELLSIRASTSCSMVPLGVHSSQVFRFCSFTCMMHVTSMLIRHISGRSAMLQCITGRVRERTPSIVIIFRSRLLSTLSLKFDCPVVYCFFGSDGRGLFGGGPGQGGNLDPAGILMIEL